MSDTPAPILQALHQAQSTEQSLTRQTLETVAAEMKVPVAQLFQVATFYHYFQVEGADSISAEVCSGPTSALPGMASDAGRDLPSIPCPGLCDQPVAQYDDGRFFSNADGAGCFTVPATVHSRQALLRHAQRPCVPRLGQYRDAGGYRQLVALGKQEQIAGLLGHTLLRENAGFHQFQIYEAGLRQYRKFASADEGGHMLIGVARFLSAHSPTVRATGQTYHIATKLNRGKSSHGED